MKKNIILKIILIINLIFIFLTLTRLEAKIEISNYNSKLLHNYRNDLLISGYIGKNEPIYILENKKLVYSEFYYNDTDEKFRKNNNYKKISDLENLEDLKKQLNFLDTLLSKYKYYSFNIENINSNDYVYFEENKNLYGSQNFIEIYYFHSETKILYYFTWLAADF